MRDRAIVVAEDGRIADELFGVVASVVLLEPAPAARRVAPEEVRAGDLSGCTQALPVDACPGARRVGAKAAVEDDVVRGLEVVAVAACGDRIHEAGHER